MCTSMNTYWEVDRPQMPVSYGVGTPEYPFEPVEWSWVDEQMADARNYWIATTGPDGVPRVSPVWGVWVSGAFHFFSDQASAKGRNIARDPRVVVHLESGDDVVIMEGEIEARDATTDVVAAYERKYGISLGDTSAAMFTLRASKVLSWLESDFPRTATRWRPQTPKS